MAPTSSVAKELGSCNFVLRQTGQERFLKCVVSTPFFSGNLIFAMTSNAGS